MRIFFKISLPLNSGFWRGRVWIFFEKNIKACRDILDLWLVAYFSSTLYVGPLNHFWTYFFIISTKTNFTCKHSCKKKVTCSPTHTRLQNVLKATKGHKKPQRAKTHNSYMQGHTKPIQIAHFYLYCMTPWITNTFVTVWSKIAFIRCWVSSSMWQPVF